MDSIKRFTRRRFVRAATLGGLGVLGVAALAGCGETQVVEVVKEVPVEKIVTQVVEKAVVQEKVVTVQVEKPRPAAVTIVHSTWWALEQAGFGLFEKKYMELYKAAKPHVTVEYRNWPWAEYHTKLLTQAAAGNQPDTFAHSNVFYPKLVKRGGSLALDEWVKTNKDFAVEDFIPTSLGLSTIGGKLYGFPHISSSWGFIFNKKVMEDAGAGDLNAMDKAGKWDWTSLLEVLKKVTKRDAGGKVERLGMGPPGLNFRDVSPFVHQNGGEVLKQPSLDEFVMNEDKAAAGVQFMGDLVSKHKVAAGAADILVSAAADLNNGRLGIQPTWANFTNFKGFPIDIVYPAKGPAKRMTIVHTNSLGASAKTKYPDEAIGFIALQASKLGDRDQADFGMGIVLRKSNMAYLTETNKRDFKVDHAEVVVEIIETGRVYDINEFHQETWDAIQPVMDKIRDGADAKKELDAIKPAIDKILEPMKKAGY